MVSEIEPLKKVKALLIEKGYSQKTATKILGWYDKTNEKTPTSS